MSWSQGVLTLPPSMATLGQQAEGVLGQVPTSQSAANQRLAALAGRAHYQPGPLATTAAALLHLRQNLDAMLAEGHYLAVTPFQHTVAQQQGKNWTLSAENAAKALGTKLRDSADALRPSGDLHAVAIMVTGNNQAELASALKTLCPLLPLPDFCATLRRLQADNAIMTQPTAPKAPHWRAAEALSWDPLRRGRRIIGAEIAQLESLAAGATTPIQRLAALAQRRAATLQTLEQQLAELAKLTGQVWHWQGQGSADSLGSQLEQGAPGAQSMTVAALLVSASPLTFWQELTS